jgi:predicted ATPase
LTDVRVWDATTAVVEEAATAVIALEQAQGDAEPFTQAAFVDKIVALQRQRQQRASIAGSEVQFYDRSPMCTYALSTYAGRPISTALSAEIDRIRRKRVYEREVFFVRNLGFCEPTAARRISFAQSLEFERIREQAYRRFGHELVEIPAGPLAHRVALVERQVWQAHAQLP